MSNKRTTEPQAATFFEWLDLEREDLKDVRTSVERQDYPSAGEALLAHFRSRTSVVSAKR